MELLTLLKTQVPNSKFHMQPSISFVVLILSSGVFSECKCDYTVVNSKLFLVRYSPNVDVFENVTCMIDLH